MGYLIMLYTITPGTRTAVESITNSLYTIFKKNSTQIMVRHITGLSRYDQLIYQIKPPFSLLEGTKWQDDWKYGSLYVEGDRMYIRLYTGDYRTDYDMCYFDLGSDEPVMYLLSNEGASSFEGRYSKLPVHAKSFNNIKSKVKYIISYQGLWGCKGFRVQTNHTFIVKMVVFDMNGDPVYLQDGRNPVAKWFRSE